MRRDRAGLGFLLLCALLAGGCASGVYVQGGLGLAQTDFKDGRFVGNVDERDLSWQLDGGIKFGRFAAAEVGYVELGETSFQGLFEGTPEVGTIDTKGYKLAVVGAIPLGQRFSVSAKAGAFRWKVEEDEIFNGIPESHVERGTDWLYGIGGQFNATQLIGVRLDWEHFLNVGNSATTGEGDIDALTASMILTWQ